MSELDHITQQFEQIGFAGPVTVLGPNLLQNVADSLHRKQLEPALDWPKGRAATSRLMYEIASHPKILNIVSRLLHGKVVLWGAEVLTRKPGQVHAWHSDIETSICDGKTVSVWIGLEHTSQDSSLILISHSHLFGATIQQVQQEQGQTRAQTTDDDVLRWAQQHDPRSQRTMLDITNGQAIFFDGRLWHGSNNQSQTQRKALLLQYASSDAAIHMPDLNQLKWPFRLLDVPRPPCILLRGDADPSVNRIVSAPISRAAQKRAGNILTSRVHPMRPPLQPDETGWKPFPLINGSTADLSHITCHVSALAPGNCPHPPHAHPEEEILMLLRGNAELELPGVTEGVNARGRVPLAPGEFVYYPAHFLHTLHSKGDVPANYLMIKWRNPITEPPKEFQQYLRSETKDHLVVNGPTRWLRKLNCHTTALAPGAGYQPHIDPYDVIIIVLQGEVETLGTRAIANDVIFYRAGEPHGMRNVGDSLARYVVFEFHGRTQIIAERDAKRPQSKPSETASIVAEPKAINWRTRIGTAVKSLRQTSAE